MAIQQRPYQLALVALFVAALTACNNEDLVSQEKNHSPIASAGSNLSGTAQSIIMLDGRLSSDPDEDALSYEWRQLGESSHQLVINQVNSVLTTATLPDVTEQTVIELQLIVSDNKGGADKDSLLITITPQIENVHPVANAGMDQQTESSTTVLLNGSASFDPDNDSLTYLWQQIDNNEIQLSFDTKDQAHTLARVPNVGHFTEFTLMLTVTDSKGATDSDLCTLLVTPAAPELKPVFSDSFDNQPDWISSNTSLPEGWSARRSEPKWSPSTGHPDRHEPIEILAANSSKAKGAQGKSAVFYRDSAEYPNYYWWSDGILAKRFENGGFDELFVEFDIRFGPGWSEAGHSKLFRIGSQDKDTSDSNFFGYGVGRYHSPIVIWDYQANDYGVRNSISLRANPHDTRDSYFMRAPSPQQLPRQMLSGDMSLNWDNNIRDLNGDGTRDQEITQLLDQTTGKGLIGQLFHHNQIYGDAWHKVQFYVRMNSGPGQPDGVLKQWLNEQLIFSNEQIPWQGSASQGGRKWNLVAIGGNDYFHTYPDTERREEWFSIDNLKVYDRLP